MYSKYDYGRSYYDGGYGRSLSRAYYYGRSGCQYGRAASRVGGLTKGLFLFRFLFRFFYVFRFSFVFYYPRRYLRFIVGIYCILSSCSLVLASTFCSEGGPIGYFCYFIVHLYLVFRLGARSYYAIVCVLGVFLATGFFRGALGRFLVLRFIFLPLSLGFLSGGAI